MLAIFSTTLHLHAVREILTNKVVCVKTRRSRVFFKRLRGVWISDETHFRVFDMASQMINNSWRNSRLKLAKFYSN